MAPSANPVRGTERRNVASGIESVVGCAIAKFSARSRHALAVRYSVFSEFAQLVAVMLSAAGGSREDVAGRHAHERAAFGTFEVVAVNAWQTRGS